MYEDNQLFRNARQKHQRLSQIKDLLLSHYKFCHKTEKPWLMLALIIILLSELHMSFA